MGEVSSLGDLVEIAGNEIHAIGGRRASEPGLNLFNLFNLFIMICEPALLHKQFKARERSALLSALSPRGQPPFAICSRGRKQWRRGESAIFGKAVLGSATSAQPTDNRPPTWECALDKAQTASALAGSLSFPITARTCHSLTWPDMPAWAGYSDFDQLLAYRSQK